MTTEIPIVETIDLSDLLIISGETDEFIRKFNTQQQRLQPWSAQLSPMAQAINAVADQIGTRHAEIVQTGTQVAEDKAAVQQLRTETGQQRQLAETAATTAAGQAGVATGAANTASQAALVAGAAEQSASEDAGIASQAATVSTEQRQLAESAAQQAAQSAIEAGPTNLSVTRTVSTLTVESSTGDDATLPAASTTEAGLMSAADKQALNGAQQTLVSGSNIKTVNGQSILGAGNITITPAAADVLTAIAATSFGSVGSYIFGAATVMPKWDYSAGTTVPGSTLYPASIYAPNGGLHTNTGSIDISSYTLYFMMGTGQTNPSVAPMAGTWRFMGGSVGSGGMTYVALGLFLRIA